MHYERFAQRQPDLESITKWTSKQEEPLRPANHTNLHRVFVQQFSTSDSNSEYATSIASKLSGMVQIKTVSFDDMKNLPPPSHPLPDDERRKGFDTLREYMRLTWPLT